MISQTLDYTLTIRIGITSSIRSYATLEAAMSAYSTAVANGAEYAKVSGPMHKLYALHGEE